MTLRNKYNPAWFPQGTIVEINNPVPSDSKPKFEIEVKSVYIHPANHAIILESTLYNEVLKMNRAFNVCHVSRVIKRGSGKVNFTAGREKIKASTENTPTSFVAYGNLQLMDVILHEVEKIDNSFRFLAHSEVIDYKKAVDAVVGQSFCKSQVVPTQEDNSRPRLRAFVCNKKRLKRFIRQNWRRWLMSKKFISSEIANYEYNMDTFYHQEYSESD